MAQAQDVSLENLSQVGSHLGAEESGGFVRVDWPKAAGVLEGGEGRWQSCPMIPS